MLGNVIALWKLPKLKHRYYANSDDAPLFESFRQGPLMERMHRYQGPSMIENPTRTVTRFLNTMSRGLSHAEWICPYSRSLCMSKPV